MEDWWWTSWERTGQVVFSAVVVLACTIAVIRAVGLRSLSKMSSFDFAVTVAIGSIVATTAATATPILDGALAVAALLGAQAVIATARRRSWLQGLVDNRPMLLMLEGVYLEEAMATCRITRDDVTAKLREANVLAMGEVRAVVLEATGDISVLHGRRSLSSELLAGVRVPEPGR